MTESLQKNEIWNVPNQFSAARLVLAFVVFALIPFGTIHHGFYWAAMIVFVLAAGTDWFDGWYARKYDQVTKLGRVLDPFCDKILICGCFVMLAVEMNSIFPWYASIAGWMAVVVIGRELLVTVLRSMIEQSGGDFSAKMAGKLKMVFQCIAVVAALVALAVNGSNSSDELMVPGWLMITLTVSIWLAVVSTLYSGLVYIFAAAKFLRTD